MTPKKCTKRCDARAIVVLLNYLDCFFRLGVVGLLIKPLFVIFFDVGLVTAVFVSVTVRSLLAICTRERLVRGTSLFDTTNFVTRHLQIIFR